MPDQPMFKLSGDVSCPYFARAKRCSDLLKAALGLSDGGIVIDAQSPDGWSPQGIYDLVGYEPTSEHLSTPGNVVVWVPLTKTVIGGEKQFAELLKKQYGISCDLPWTDCIKLADDAHTLFKYIQEQNATLRPAVSVLLPPLPGVSGLRVAQRVADGLGWACASGSEAVKVRMMQRPDVHAGTVQADAAKQWNLLFTSRGSRPPAAAAPQPRLRATPSPASVWACEGIAQAFDDSEGPTVLLNAPRDEAQVLLLREVDARWRAVVAVDVSAEGAPAADAARYEEYGTWVKRTRALAETAGVPVVLVPAVADADAMVAAVTAACEALPKQ